MKDEPTNDLDAETLDLLEELVANYSGTLLLVSHDRAFIDNVVTSTLVFEGGGVINEYVGGYSDWLRQRRPAGAKVKAQPKPPAPAPEPAVRSRKLSYRELRELEELPKSIQRLETEQAALTTAIADPQLFRRDPGAAADAAQRLKIVAQELETTFARWETLETGRTGA